MRLIVVFVLASFLLPALLNAQQACFPLNVGDTWQYVQYVDRNSDHLIVNERQTTVVGDTLMPNGRHYAILSDRGWWSYMRQLGDSVLIWSPHGEWLYFDFTRIVGDTTVTSTGQPGNTVFLITTARDTFNIFGRIMSSGPANILRSCY